MQNRPPVLLDPNPISSVMHEQPGLRQLLLKAQEIQRANAVLATQLPAEMLTHCQVMQIEARCITIGSDHAAWATHVRYQQNRLISAFQKSIYFGQITQLRVRVLPKVTKPKKAGRRLAMSHQVGDLIEGTAEGITDPSLKAALLRLAGNAKPE